MNADKARAEQIQGSFPFGFAQGQDDGNGGDVQDEGNGGDAQNEGNEGDLRAVWKAEAACFVR